MYKIRTIIDGDWEQLVDDNNNVLVESHHLDAEDILHALGIKYECEDVYEEEL